MFSVLQFLKEYISNEKKKHMSSGNNLQDIGSLILVTLYAVYYFQMLRHG